MSDGGIWNHYWHFDRIASCFDGAGATNYERLHRRRLARLLRRSARRRTHPRPVHRQRRRRFDRRRGQQGRRRSSPSTAPTSIRPPSSPATPNSTPRSDFRGGVEVEALPFAAGRLRRGDEPIWHRIFGPSRSLPEAVRVLAPGGRIRFVVHAADGIVAAGARAVIADADLLLDGDRPHRLRRRAASRHVIAVERDGGDSGLRRRQLRRLPGRAGPNRPAIAAARTTGRCSAIPARCCSTPSSAAAISTSASCSPRPSRCATRSPPIAAGWSPSVEAALDARRRGAGRPAQRRSAASAASRPLANADGLIAHVVAARIP